MLMESRITRAERCDQLIELHRVRQDLHRAEKALTLQIRAQCRRLARGDKAEADRIYDAMLGKREHPDAAVAYANAQGLLEARSALAPRRKAIEAEMTALARELPVAPWVDGVRGFGLLGLASIIGEAGDLANYPNPAKLWKRLGLGLVGAERQQRKSGDAALEHGYSPSRRAVVWTIGDSLFRANGPYADLCRERKDHERAKAAAEGLTVVPSARIPKGRQAEYRSDGHIHARAKRWMEKRLVRDLWHAWRDYGDPASDEPTTET